MRHTIWLTAVCLAGGLFGVPAASAQHRYRTPNDVVDAADVRDCRVEKGPGGLIRGDRIPSGCVIHEGDGAAPVVYDGRNVYQVVRTEGGVLLAGNSIYHTPGSVNVILSDGTLAGLSTAGPPQFGGQLAERPRRVAGPTSSLQPLRTRHFGPIERNFGSQRRNFGREPGAGLSRRD